MAAPWQGTDVYKRFWQLAWYSASTISPATGGIYQSSDLISGANEVAKAEGNPLAFSDNATLTQMYSTARTMERASDAITAAADNEPITSDHISEPPWAGTPNLRQTVPMWEARAEITYNDPQGLQITAWRTVIIPQVLPSTVGGLRDLMASRYQDMLRTQTTKSPSVGTLVSIGKTYLFTV